VVRKKVVRWRKEVGGLMAEGGLRGSRVARGLRKRERARWFDNDLSLAASESGNARPAGTGTV
jgi:hypothetical protein